MNILISSLGTNTVIIEETIGLFNWQRKDFYERTSHRQEVQSLRKKNNIPAHAVDEVWLVTTNRQKNVDGPSIEDDFNEIIKTCGEDYEVKFRLFLLDGVNDIDSQENAEAFHDLTLRVVKYAHQQGDKIYVSLACGRKTMSADMQDAAILFGCDGLIHVVGQKTDDALPIWLGSMKQNETMTSLENVNFVIPNDDKPVRCPPQTTYLEEVNRQKERASYFYTSYYMADKEPRSNFYILYTLPPSKIAELKSSFIGVDPKREQEDLDYLRLLPKTDLHCHLGGVLSPKEMIRVAKCYEHDIDMTRKQNPKYDSWLKTLDKYSLGEPWKTKYNELATQLEVHKGLIVAPYLMQFDGCPEVLDSLIYDKYIDEEKFVGIDITPYEELGDLQGSALLCQESALRETVRILLENCQKENVRYLEVRCSPANYESYNMSKEQVMNAILEELDAGSESVTSSVIIIASRHHGGGDNIQKSIDLVDKMRSNALFVKYFRGFDLAGNEKQMSPREARKSFEPVMKDCLNITIHAGETMEAESIWEAVYELTAERIGHGLTLQGSPDLMNKMLERSIGIEMCPSSNFQIRGYKDAYLQRTLQNDVYPLKKYLDYGLLVSINTDDPGISRTDITHEYLKAARMTEGGLSKWTILQLVCNGFRTAFFPYKEKARLIKETEEKIEQLIKDDKL